MALAGGDSALVTGPARTDALLSAVSRLLADTRTRVLHVRPPLDLRAFMDQVSPATVQEDDAAIERGFSMLTTPDPSCDRIVLLIEDAHLLPPTTLEYVELALRFGPHLQVGFAGHSRFVDTLALDQYAWLRERISLHLVSLAPPPDPPFLATLPPRSRWVMRPVAPTGAAIAAMLALTVGVVRSTPTPPPAAVAVPEPSGMPLAAVIAPSAEPLGPQPATVPEPPPAQEAALSPSLTATVPSSLPSVEPPPAPSPAVMAELPKVTASPASSRSSEQRDLPLAPLAIAAGPPAIQTATTSEPAPASGPNPVPAITADGPPPSAPDVAGLQPAILAPPDPAEAPTPAPPSMPMVAAAESPALPDPASSSAGLAYTSPPRAPPALTAALPDALPTPPLPPRAPPRSPAAYVERTAVQPATSKQNERHCRDIVLRVQLGENPTDGDRKFLHNGCR